MFLMRVRIAQTLPSRGGFVALGGCGVHTTAANKANPRVWNDGKRMGLMDAGIYD